MPGLKGKVKQAHAFDVSLSAQKLREASKIGYLASIRMLSKKVNSKFLISQ